MSHYVIAPEAFADLQNIREWIARDSLTRAADFLDGLLVTFRHLADWPMSGRIREEIRPRLRSFVHREYLIFYRPTSDGIVILRVIHGKRDVSKVFQ